MPEDKLIIKTKRPKGEDGFRTFSIRTREETAQRLDEVCIKSGYSRNAIIGAFLDYALENCEIQEDRHDYPGDD